LYLYYPMQFHGAVHRPNVVRRNMGKHCLFSRSTQRAEVSYLLDMWGR
jgi:hypothetical protein